VARRLAARLLALDDAALGALEGAAGAGVVAVFGEASALPWVDGVEWLGRVPEGPALWLPTALDPGLPADLLQRAALRRTGGVGPVVLVPELLVPVDPLPVARAHLERWVGGG
jgi:hypothetical protein